MIVYRYLSEQHALDALQKRRWKIGRILELNDPLDCRPVIYQNGSPIDSRAPLPSALQKAYESLGIICYSRKIEDLVIWTHYGDNHAGIALGFEYTAFPPHEVNYPIDNKRFRIDADNLPAAYLSPKAGLEEKLVNGVRRRISTKTKRSAPLCQSSHGENAAKLGLGAPGNAEPQLGIFQSPSAAK